MGSPPGKKEPKGCGSSRDSGCRESRSSGQAALGLWGWNLPGWGFWWVLGEDPQCWCFCFVRVENQPKQPGFEPGKELLKLSHPLLAVLCAC